MADRAQCRFAVRHPLLLPSAASSRPGFLEPARDRAAARRSTNALASGPIRRRPNGSRRAIDSIAEKNVGEIVSAGAGALRTRGKRNSLRNEILRNAPLARLERGQVEQMKALIRAIARRPARAATASRASASAAGIFDIRRDAAPQCGLGRRPLFSPHGNAGTATGRRSWRCAMSAARWRQVSDFFLLLIHSLHEVSTTYASFAFSGHLDRGRDILDTKSPEEAMSDIMSKVGFGSSDYGGSLVDFEKGWIKTVDAEDDGDRARRRPHQQPRSASPISCAAFRNDPSDWSGSTPKAGMAWGWGDFGMPR